MGLWVWDSAPEDIEWYDCSKKQTVSSDLDTDITQRYYETLLCSVVYYSVV
jgi:hypothetical protein